MWDLSLSGIKPAFDKFWTLPKHLMQKNLYIFPANKRFDKWIQKTLVKFWFLKQIDKFVREKGPVFMSYRAETWQINVGRIKKTSIRKTESEDWGEEGGREFWTEAEGEGTTIAIEAGCRIVFDVTARF